VAKTDTERRVVINTVGPVWEGNQVWFILGGGAIFAAWPPLYAVSFSGFCMAMFLILAALILRPVGFKYRSKRDSHAWCNGWDWALFVGGAVPALLFGVAVGNVLLGVPFGLTDNLFSLYEGTFFQLLHPFALLAGVASLAMLIAHGVAWLTVKADPPAVVNRARRFHELLLDDRKAPKPAPRCAHRTIFTYPQIRRIQPLAAMGLSMGLAMIVVMTGRG